MLRWKDWFEQGERDLGKARLDMEHGYCEWACFTAQQAAEKVVKSLAIKLGYSMWGHSITEILKILATDLQIPAQISEAGQTLDIFYIPARYPNGFPQGKPADYFNAAKAEEAINAGDRIIEFCKSRLFE